MRTSINPMLLEIATTLVFFAELEAETASGSELLVGEETMMTTVVVVKGVGVLVGWSTRVVDEVVVVE